MSEFKNLPSGWKVVRLDKVAPLQRGYDLPADNVKEGLYPVVYSNGILKFHNEFKAKAPGVITGRSGTIGKVIYVEKDYWPHNTSLWVTNFCGNNPKFIYYMYINLNLIRFSAGSGVPTLNRNDIHLQKILLPPLDEQEKIAKILSTWDEAINLTINLIESKKQFKKAIMQNLLTAKIRFPEFKDEWQETKLGKILKERKAYQNKGFDMEHVSLTKDGVVPKSERYDRDFLVKDDNKQYKITRLNDICYNPANLKFGVICKNIYGDGIFSPIYVTFECCNELDNDFAGFYLTQNDFIQKVRKFEEGTVYERMAVSPEDFLRFKIKLPNLNEQQKIAEVLMACDDEINLLNLKLENLKKQKQGLMQKLLIGETRTCYVKKAM
jgi:putative hsdS